MKLNTTDDVHLAYCTNIHPGESWAEVCRNLEQYLPAVKERLAPDVAFGVGLRLSAAAADELQTPGVLDDLKALLDAHNLYVFTINGFPYGPFHGVRVKEEVYLPDWRDGERLRYTNMLATLLTELLPSEPTLEGSVSTVPGAFKPEIKTHGDVELMVSRLIEAAVHLVKLRLNSGKTITLALEPEPCCYLETIEETISFFQEHLFAIGPVGQLAKGAGLSASDAEDAMRRHIGVCLDLCHAAVEFEDPETCLSALRKAGVRVGKMQLSAGLRFVPVTERTVELLRAFDDRVYLHQVVERNESGFVRFTDLEDAFATVRRNNARREWRVHCHIPIFLDDLGEFGTTQPFMREILARQRQDPISRHLEVETYTWGVLPEAYREENVVSAIAREMRWVRQQLDA